MMKKLVLLLGLFFGVEVMAMQTLIIQNGVTDDVPLKLKNVHFIYPAKWEFNLEEGAIFPYKSSLRLDVDYAEINHIPVNVDTLSELRTLGVELDSFTLESDDKSITFSIVPHVNYLMSVISHDAVGIRALTLRQDKSTSTTTMCIRNG